MAAESSSADRAEANLRAALLLFGALLRAGLVHAVLCPGSRSAPLAVAAGLLQRRGLRLHTALDERSAAFFALGLARATGMPAAVITTSGSAVAQLLPACVEADHGAIPLLLLSADRPDRLKGCGANQSVNQEDFLRHSCRWFGQASGTGMGGMEPAAVEALAAEAYLRSLGGNAALPAGPVHLNLPFEEPLHVGAASLASLSGSLDVVAELPLGPALPVGAATTMPAPATCAASPTRSADPARGAAHALPTWIAAFGAASPSMALVALDPDRPGVVVAGPWRGRPQAWEAHLEGLIRWQQRSGWPVLADPLSGLRGQAQLACVGGYDLLLESPDPALAPTQVLRLGSLPSSRRLERWLAGLDAEQVLVSEGDPRPLDPLAVVKGQSAAGMGTWVSAQLAGDQTEPRPEAEARRGPEADGSCRCLAEAWRGAEERLQALLDRELSTLEAAARPWSEPALARRLSRLLPPGLPLMLANSSPVRDWESFADPAAPPRLLVGFRGASGIDGTLSEACGLAEALGSCLLLTGDLALLHDANGWLWRPQLRGRLTVLVIDNGGGGIFEQLPIRIEPAELLDFDRLFAMPQPVDPLALAQAHGVPARLITSPAALPEDLAWALAQPFSLLVVRTDRRHDAELRRRLRTMAALGSASR
ncbi:MAG: 2-succinyl-5-enolpyruvyl-6-hydroxy-3-cyclohexene-1-carboxylic-acid synthase [Cyanobacteria bacterium]|nr:2-succinyl-5-enolpyruvyl-6-hydroxy-3-cyclohexene-1-carboxylic-acid synthase [Cyanobacteriota bacterium]